jgi:SAM-dependent methyltransferase
MQRVFDHIRRVNLWQSQESVSGRGSELACTAALRAALPDLFQQLEVTSILDAPCGDFNWMQHVPRQGITYTGMDIVPELIEGNQQRYASPAVQFRVGDITQDPLPSVDLIISRDCLVHLSWQDACRALHQFQQSGSRYLLTTTYPGTSINRDAPTGSWKPLNLCQPPFNLANPLLLLPDPSDDTGANPDKSMGLWELPTLNLPAVPRWSSLEVLGISLIRRYINPSWKL